MILVVDDDKSLNQLVCRLLEDDGYSVECAYDGQCAYNRIKEAGHFACIILDMHMPQINGAELLMLLAADDLHIPVLVMAGFEDFEAEEIKRFPNVKGFFAKPFYPEELLEKVQELVPHPEN